MYYQLYANDSEMHSKVAFDPEEPSLGRIRADSVAPPHSPVSIKRCISRVEETPALAHADLYADISCDAPMQDGHISTLRNDGPGQRLNEPMAIVQLEMPIVQVENSIPNGRYLIKNRAADIFWKGHTSIMVVHFVFTPDAKKTSYLQVSVHSRINQVFEG